MEFINYDLDNPGFDMEWESGSQDSNDDISMVDADDRTGGQPPFDEPVLAPPPRRPRPSSSPPRIDDISREPPDQSLPDLSQNWTVPDSGNQWTLPYVPIVDAETLEAIFDAISELGGENIPHWVRGGHSKTESCE